MKRTLLGWLLGSILFLVAYTAGALSANDNDLAYPLALLGGTACGWIGVMVIGDV